jgi:ATP-dependent Clp protease ATP-binding subunit ClpB
VLFKALQLHEIKQIVDLLVKDLRRRLADRKITLELTEAGRELIAREGFDPVFGARPLRRYIQRDVETQIARALIAGDAPDGSHVIADVRDGRLDVRIEPPATQGDSSA